MDSEMNHFLHLQPSAANGQSQNSQVVSKRRGLDLVENSLNSPSRKRLKILPDDSESCEKVIRIINKEFTRAIEERRQTLSEIEAQILKGQHQVDHLRKCVSLNKYVYGQVVTFDTKRDAKHHPVTLSMAGIVQDNHTPLCVELPKPKLHHIPQDEPLCESETSASCSRAMPWQDVKKEKSRQKCMLETTKRNITVRGRQIKRYTSEVGQGALMCKGAHAMQGYAVNTFRIVVGNLYQLQDSCVDQTLKFKWFLYIRGGPGEADCSAFVNFIEVTLDPSFSPNHIITLREFPFHLSRRGWGEFVVELEIHFKDKRNKPLRLTHPLSLVKQEQSSVSGIWRLGVEKWYDVSLIAIKEPAKPDPPFNPWSVVPKGAFATEINGNITIDHDPVKEECIEQEIISDFIEPIADLRPPPPVLAKKPLIKINAVRRFPQCNSVRVNNPNGFIVAPKFERRARFVAPGVVRPSTKFVKLPAMSVRNALSVIPLRAANQIPVRRIISLVKDANGRITIPRNVPPKSTITPGNVEGDQALLKVTVKKKSVVGYAKVKLSCQQRLRVIYESCAKCTTAEQIMRTLSKQFFTTGFTRRPIPLQEPLAKLQIGIDNADLMFKIGMMQFLLKKRQVLHFEKWTVPRVKCWLRKHRFVEFARKVPSKVDLCSLPPLNVPSHCHVDIHRVSSSAYERQNPDSDMETDFLRVQNSGCEFVTSKCRELNIDLPKERASQHLTMNTSKVIVWKGALSLMEDLLRSAYASACDDALQRPPLPFPPQQIDLRHMVYVLKNRPEFKPFKTRLP